MSERVDSRGGWNAWIASRLREAHDLLAQQGANPFRAGAYNQAAESLEALTQDVRTVYQDGGLEALDAIPRVGPSIAASIAEMINTGRWAQLERLRGQLEPEELFQVIPGIGPALSRDIHDALHVDTLEALEVAAYDGRLAKVKGIGPDRLAIIRQSLTNLLARRRPGTRQNVRRLPPVDLVLDVDLEYRRRAQEGTLPRIAPRRFNPEGKAWLPILHTDRGKWHFTALYSNTPQAHRFGRTEDWVVLYAHSDDDRESQCTVVTEHEGRYRGRRVVRGREGACAEFYRASEPEEQRAR